MSISLPRSPANCAPAANDVIAVKENASLVGRADRVHFAAMNDQRRAIVTQDLGDFRPLLAEAARSGERTYGLVCLPAPVSLRLSAIGQLVNGLERLLQQHPAEDAATDFGGEIWLTPGPS